MSEHRAMQLFKSAGFTGIDKRHISVRVYPYLEIVDGKPIASHRVYIGAGKGDYRASTITDYIYVCASKDWVFHEFELAGTTWPGLVIYPEGGDFKVKYGNSDKTSVILHDTCKTFYTYRYQIVLRNTITGELATCDPDSDNSDDQGITGG